jgi:hypothetical protein
MNTTNDSAGATYNQILVADFDNVRKTVKVTGTSVSGALVVNGESAKLTQTSIEYSDHDHHWQPHIQGFVWPVSLGNASVGTLRRDKQR